MKLSSYDTFPVLVGEIITLRPVQTADISHLVEISYYDSVGSKRLLNGEMKLNMN